VISIDTSREQLLFVGEFVEKEHNGQEEVQEDPLEAFVAW
jgi:hypothetical protein